MHFERKRGHGTLLRGFSATSVVRDCRQWYYGRDWRALALPASTHARRVRSEPSSAEPAATRRKRFDLRLNSRRTNGNGPEKSPPVRVVMSVTSPALSSFTPVHSSNAAADRR